MCDGGPHLLISLSLRTTGTLRTIKDLEHELSRMDMNCFSTAFFSTDLSDLTDCLCHHEPII